MSKPRYAWWGYVKTIIRRYPILKREYEDSLQQSIVPAYDSQPHGGAVSNPVETTVIRALSSGTAEEYLAVQKAIDHTLTIEDGSARLKLIEMIFWRQTHTLQGAARVTYVSPRTARRRVAEFIRCVARYRGLL